jgi:hypothetical protein
MALALQVDGGKKTFAHFAGTVRSAGGSSRLSASPLPAGAACRKRAARTNRPYALLCASS